MLSNALTLAVDVLAVQDPGSVAPPGSDRFLQIAGWAKWGTGIACVIGLAIVAAMMALSHRRGSGGEHGAAVGWVSGAAILSGVGAAMLTALGA